MRRFPALILIFIVILTGSLSLPAASFAANQPVKRISVYIDGLPVSFDVPPVIQNGRILVPFRALAEALNVTVAWDGNTRTVNAQDGSTSVQLQVGNETAYRGGTAIALDAPPVIVNGRVLIPARFFTEAFGCQVGWDGAESTAKITSAAKPMTVLGFYALGDTKTSSWTNLFGLPYPGTDKGNTDLVNEAALGWYSLDDQGNLLTQSRTGWQRPDGWESVLSAMSAYNIKTEMVVHLADGDGTITRLLANRDAMAKAAAAIAEEAKAYNGVDLDFEGLGWQDQGEKLTAVRNSFTAFAGLLAEQLRANNLKLTLTLHAPNSAYQGYDYQALGAVADRIVIMAYDYGSKPEPVRLVLQAVEAARAVVPAQKLVLGISAPNETAESILTKVGIAKRYGLSGIALWRLGLVPADMWNALRTTVQVRE